MKLGFCIMMGTVAALLALPALACEPSLMEVQKRPIRGAECAVSQVVSPSHEVGLDAAKALSGGFVIQQSREGNGCTSASSLIVSDCKAGKVVILGEARFDLMTSETPDPMAALQSSLTALAGQGALTLDAAAKAALASGLDRLAHAETRDGIAMSGKHFALDCGCKTFWPDLNGGQG